MKSVHLLVSRSFVLCSVAITSLFSSVSCSADTQDIDSSQCNECIPIATKFIEAVFKEPPALARVQNAYYDEDICAVACIICIKTYDIVIANSEVIGFYDSAWPELREGEDNSKIETAEEAFDRCDSVLSYYNMPRDIKGFRIYKMPIGGCKNWGVFRKIVWNDMPVRDKEFFVEVNGESGRIVMTSYEKRFKPPVNIGSEITQQEATDRAARWFSKTYPREIPGGLQSAKLQSVSKVVAPYGRGIPKRLRDDSLKGKYFLCWETSYSTEKKDIINILIRIDSGDIIGINSEYYAD